MGCASACGVPLTRAQIATVATRVGGTRRCVISGPPYWSSPLRKRHCEMNRNKSTTAGTSDKGHYPTGRLTRSTLDPGPTFANFCGHRLGPISALDPACFEKIKTKSLGRSLDFVRLETIGFLAPDRFTACGRSSCCHNRCYRSKAIGQAILPPCHPARLFGYGVPLSTAMRDQC